MKHSFPPIRALARHCKYVHFYQLKENSQCCFVIVHPKSIVKANFLLFLGMLLMVTSWVDA
jgi:hypothetical protein